MSMNMRLYSLDDGKLNTDPGVNIFNIFIICQMVESYNYRLMMRSIIIFVLSDLTTVMTEDAVVVLYMYTWPKCHKKNAYTTWLIYFPVTFVGK